MKEEPKDIKSIFSEALERENPEERADYLNEACGNDMELRSKVEALLKAHQQAGSFLNAPALGPDVTLDTSPLTEGPGTIIGRYKLLEQIGEGGFGVVYMAEQQEPIRRRVALKIIKLGMDTKQVIARFEAERQALAMMDHPNIARVFDAGATDTGRPYFVMELVKGIPITEYCDKNNLDTQQRLELFIDVCKAVQHAHQKGIIHRDIKPSNVMITLHDGKPVPKVIDFGIAKATSHRLTEKTLFTKYAQMIGTPEYMSPEQAEMSGLDIDTRTDIYSLGVLIYELLTGSTPFDAKELREAGYAEMQRIIRETEPLKPSTKLSTMGDALTDIAKHRQTNPDLLAKLVRGDLDWIAMKTLEKDRTRRYETANELSMDIQRHLSNEPVEAGPPSTIYRIRKFVQRHRRTVAAAAAIAAILIIGLVVSSSMYFLANRARRSEAIARTQAEQARNAEQEQRKVAETKAEDLRRSSYVNNIQLADSKYQEGNIRRVRELLNACPNDLRGWEWKRLNYISDQSIMTLRGHQGYVYSVILTPGDKRIISGGADGTIKVWNAETGAELMTLCGHKSAVYSLAISPNGKHIISGSADQTIRVWDVEAGTKLMILQGHESAVTSVALSLDGKRIISGSGDKTIKVWDAETGNEVMTLHSQEKGETCVAFSPDGKRIVSGSDDGTVIVWDTASAKKLMVFNGHKGGVSSVKFSPDGKYIASGSYDGTVKLWNASTAEQLMTLQGPKGVRSISYDQNGKRIVSCSVDNTIKIWDAATGEELITLHGHCDCVNSAVFNLDGKMVISGSWDQTIKVWDIGTCSEQVAMQISRTRINSIAFSPDGKRVVSSDGEVWDAETGAELMKLSGLKEWFFSVSFSPDGKRIVSGSWDYGTIKIWDSTTGAELMTIRGHEGTIYSVTFNPDGQRIVSGSWDDVTTKVWDAKTGVELMKLSGHRRWSRALTYSPDGARIISSGADNTIKIWDAVNGAEFLTTKGHHDMILSLSVSPNGKLIVSGGWEGTTKIWDAATGRELMNLSGHIGPVCSASFSPDGKRIVSSSSYGDVKLWDVSNGAELISLDVGGILVRSVAFSPDGRTIAAGGYGGIVVWETTKPAGGYGPRQTTREARELVDKLYEKHGYYYEVIDKLQTDKTIDELVRKIALQIANARRGEDAWKDAGKMVEQLYQKHGYYYDVINELQVDNTLDEPVRKIALQIANSRKWEDADKLNGESWKVVSSPGGDPNAYRVALEKAQKASNMEPNDYGILNTLGIAQYRVGAYQDALMTLLRADKMRTDANELSVPEDLAFMAIALQKLGRVEEAKVALDRLRTLLKDGQFAKNEQAKAFLAEAEKLIEGKKK